MKGSFRLRLYRILKLHRGEERKTFIFLWLQVFLSASLGLLSSGIDPLYLKHDTGTIELFLLELFAPAGGWIGSSEPNVQLIPFLLLLGAVLLVCAGFVYSGFTDRSNKVVVFSWTVLSVILVCLASFIFWVVDYYGKPIPPIFSLLYTWRFVAGVFLLLIFWDLAQVYFDARQAKRLFPLMFGAGALGYAGGSLLVSPFAIMNALGAVFFFSAGFCIVSLYLCWKIRAGFQVVSPPRYREKTLKEEISEGLTILRENVFLRNLLFSTAVFGIAAGMIMVGYHAIIDTSIKTLSGAAGLMAFQRALATILEAVIVTQVLSQTRLGGALRIGIIIRIALLGIGLLAYLVSMIGVADFTRQIAMALLSPAVIASYAVLPSRFRGRVMALNTMVVAPAGMGIAALGILVFSGSMNLRVFLAFVAVALGIRLMSNQLVSRSYLHHLRNGFDRGQGFSASLVNSLGYVFIDETIIEQIVKDLSASDPSIQRYVWKILASGVKGKAEYEILKKYRPQPGSPPWSIWLVLAGRYDYRSISDEAEQAFTSNDQWVRLNARAAMMEGKADQVMAPQFKPEQGVLGKEDIEILEAMMLAKISPLVAVEAIWKNLAVETKRDLLHLFGRYPEEIPGLLPILADAAQDEALIPAVLSSLEGVDSIEPLFLMDCFENIPEKLRFDVVEYLSGVNSPKIGSFLTERFLHLSEVFVSQDQSGWKDSLRRQQTWRDSRNRELISFALALLRAPIKIDAEVREAGSRCAGEGIKTAACLYRGWRNGVVKTKDPCISLFSRFMGKQIEELVQLVLSCSGLSLKSAEERKLLHGSISDNGFSLPFIKGRILEVVESCLSKDVAVFAAAFLEDLSDAERDLRVFPFIRGFYITFRDLIELWFEDYSGEPGNPDRLLVEYFHTII